MPRTGMQSFRRSIILSWSSLSQSASVSLALLKTVSPEVMGQTTTPSMARMTPTLPMILIQTL